MVSSDSSAKGKSIYTYVKKHKDASELLCASVRRRLAAINKLSSNTGSK